MKTNIKYRGRKDLLMEVNNSRHNGLGINRYFAYHVMPYGKERREAILAHLRTIRNDPHNYIVINKKYCLILKKDPDLKRLLKQGKLKMNKITFGGDRCTYSVLRLNDENLC